MNEQELKKLWQQQSLRQPDLSAERLIPALQKQTTQFRRIISARDFRELAACAIVIVVFGYFYFTVYLTLVSRIGDLIIIGSTFFIVWRIIHTRRNTPPAPPGATLVEFLRAELKSVSAQSRLLGSVLWWYVLPPGIGLLVATWGLPTSVTSKIVSTVFFLAVDVFVWRLNRWARSKQLVPAEAQLRSLLHSIETGEPVDQTYVAGLRPLLLSLEAADRVRPVEFKVAFWQIALYGEIGVLGIWFFLMLGLTLDIRDWKTAEQPVEQSAPAVPAEETNPYSVVARKIVELLNTGDFAAVQERFDPGMSRFLPPKKATAFFADLTARYGKLGKLSSPTNSPDGWTIFRLPCRRGDLNMGLALDAQDQISGLYFRPAPRPFPGFKLFIPRLFSWPHLIWIVPFFLAGLLSSWLLQKLTLSAVGI